MGISAEADLITADEAALILNCHRSSVARAARDGELRPAVKLPGRTGAYLFSRQVVEIYAASLQRERATKAAS